ncbi:MAG: helix-turn-helix domain-containing protein [Prochlorotrichaceae cyanobacterium]
MIVWRLKELMADRGLTYRDLAQITGRSLSTCSTLKNRRFLSRIDMVLLNALCEGLDCQPGDLLQHQK